MTDGGGDRRDRRRRQ